FRSKADFKRLSMPNYAYAIVQSLARGAVAGMATVDHTRQLRHRLRDLLPVLGPLPRQLAHRPGIPALSRSSLCALPPGAAVCRRLLSRTWPAHHRVQTFRARLRGHDHPGGRGWFYPAGLSGLSRRLVSRAHRFLQRAPATAIAGDNRLLARSPHITESP